MSLKETLNNLKQTAASRIPPETLREMSEATEQLRNSGIMESVIRPGTAMPAFALKNQDGVEILSNDLLSQGAVVLTVFRGHW